MQTKNVLNEEIHLDILSPHYPNDLQFVDLPGFTKCPLENQDDDIEEQIRQMNFAYMEDPNTIMLAVHDSTVDLANSEVIKHALE